MKLRYTKQALVELAQILDGIEKLSPQGARHVKSSIHKAARLLAEHPYSGQRTSHRALRRIVARPYPYLIFYRVTAAEILVIGIRHSARDPASMPDIS